MPNPAHWIDTRKPFTCAYYGNPLAGLSGAMMFLLLAIPKVLGWDIQLGGQAVNFQLQVGTIKGIGYVEFQPDCLPEPVTMLLR